MRPNQDGVYHQTWWTSNQSNGAWRSIYTMDNQFYTIDFLVTEQEVRHSVKGGGPVLPLTTYLFCLCGHFFRLCGRFFRLCGHFLYTIDNRFYTIDFI
jgi:hypothetical protein